MRDRETGRLWLRRWGGEYAPGLADVNAHAEVMRYLNGGIPLTREESDEVSRRVAEHWQAYGFGLWAAVEKTSERMIGFVGICHPTWFPQWASAVEVGWRLHPDVWGRGLATEAAREGLRAGFDECGFEEIVAFVHPENHRSVAVTERLGMTLEHELPHPDRDHALKVFVTRPG